jgi:hypothetical protein
LYRKDVVAEEVPQFLDDEEDDDEIQEDDDEMEEEENEMQEEEAEGLITQYYSQPKNVCAFAFLFNKQKFAIKS